jgi:hypothetical protein
MPQNGMAHYHLAKALLALGRREEAGEALRAALARSLPGEERQDAEAAARSGAG